MNDDAQMGPEYFEGLNNAAGVAREFANLIAEMVMEASTEDLILAIARVKREGCAAIIDDARVEPGAANALRIALIQQRGPQR